ncbi:AT-hook motif nuclear-localized protein 7-like isoform X6 [Musa acuminata AAA Group]|uniref:AT-hook motif nuclear-localized protein 7-like isoform X6 n=1 Tax=Musa acuminata AAA Group TaxID=214697 RepID=UPI0031E17747
MGVAISLFSRFRDKLMSILINGGETSTVSKHGNPAQFHDCKHPHGQRGTGDSGSPSLLSAVQTNQLLQQKDMLAANHGLADNVVAALEGSQADVQWSTWGLPPRYPSIARNISEATYEGGNYNKQEYMNILGGTGSGSHDASVLHEHPSEWSIESMPNSEGSMIFRPKGSHPYPGQGFEDTRNNPSATSPPNNEELLKQNNYGEPSKYLFAAVTPTTEFTKKVMHETGGFGKKQHTRGPGPDRTCLIPHVITIRTNEDIYSKIISFCQKSGSNAVCILSANGTVSRVTLLKPAASLGTITYEGQFDIVKLSGSFMPLESCNQSRHSGELRVMLARADGHVFGGGLAGPMMAASSVLIVLGRFLPNGGNVAMLANNLFMV